MSPGVCHGLETATGVTECREIGESDRKGPRARQGRKDRGMMHLAL